MDSRPEGRGVYIGKVTVLRRFQSLVHPSWAVRSITTARIARCTKGISSVLAYAKTGREYFMALTFGTLLSSQGADAHRRGSFEPFGGNPSYITRSVSQGQTRSRTTRSSHLVGAPMPLATGECSSNSVLGGCPPGSAMVVLGRFQPLRRLRLANNDNTSTRRERASKPGCVIKATSQVGAAPGT